MISETLDRRTRKTRALLTQGLISLMKEKDIKDISVKELADLVDINRGTFYLHYSDIYDMVDKIEVNLFEKFEEIIRKDFPKEIKNTSYYEVLLDIFQAINENRELAKVLIGPHGDLTFVNRMKDMIKNQLKAIMSTDNNSDTIEYQYAFIVSGYIGVVETWLRTDSPLSPEEMAKLCNNMVSTENL